MRQNMQNTPSPIIAAYLKRDGGARGDWMCMLLLLLLIILNYIFSSFCWLQTSQAHWKLTSVTTELPLLSQRCHHKN